MNGNICLYIYVNNIAIFVILNAYNVHYLSNLFIFVFLVIKNFWKLKNYDIQEKFVKNIMLLFL